MEHQDREEGEAGLKVVLVKGVISVYHQDGPLLFERIARSGDWDKIIKELKGTEGAKPRKG